METKLGYISINGWFWDKINTSQFDTKSIKPVIAWAIKCHIIYCWELDKLNDIIKLRLPNHRDRGTSDGIPPVSTVPSLPGSTNTWPPVHTTAETTMQSSVFINVILVQQKSAFSNHLWCLQKLKPKITKLHNPIKAF